MSILITLVQERIKYLHSASWNFLDDFLSSNLPGSKHCDVAFRGEERDEILTHIHSNSKIISIEGSHAYNQEPFVAAGLEYSCKMISWSLSFL